MKEFILKEAENNYEVNYIEYYFVERDLYIYTTSCRNEYGSIWGNRDIIISTELPSGMSEYIRLMSDNWMVKHICEYNRCDIKDINQICNDLISFL